jgi:ABC-type transporter Mla MlaB component
MDFEDAQFFMKKELKTIDIDTGDIQVEDVGGYNLLLRFVASVKEQMEMFFSMLISMGFDELTLDKIKNEVYSTELNDKKKVTLNKKKMKKIKKA